MVGLPKPGPRFGANSVLLSTLSCKIDDPESYKLTDFYTDDAFGILEISKIIALLI